jgi:predicted nucleotidyltransferase
MVGRGIQLDLQVGCRVLRGHPEILAAYLYGSYAKGCPRTDSDVDIAILLRERRGRLTCNIPATYEVDLGNALGMALNRSGVEVIVLNDATPLLAREAIRGQRFFTRDARVIARYEVRVRQRYLDTAHLRAIQDQYLDAIIGRGFSKAVSR